MGGMNNNMAASVMAMMGGGMGGGMTPMGAMQGNQSMAPSVNFDFDAPAHGVKRPRTEGGMPMGGSMGGSSAIPQTQAQFVVQTRAMVGQLLGKGGANINQVRQQSGANIRVEGDQAQKFVSIEGNLVQVGSACSMIGELLMLA